MENMVLSSVPEPPTDLASRQPIIENIDAPLFRISNYSRGQSGVIFFGSRDVKYRFDDPQGVFGVCYLGLDEYAAFIEVFGQARKTTIDSTFISDRSLSRISLSRPAKLINLTGNGLARIGATSEIFSGEHSLSQRWARAIYEHNENFDGILYPCRHDPSRKSAALFERDPRTDLVLEVEAYTKLLSDNDSQVLLGNIMDHYAFGLI
jgi:hypothetical protein